MLVTAAGEYAGSVSGGCLEAEVVRKAAWTVREGAVVERFSTLFDDTAEMPYGLGCGGTVDLLIEPAGTAECEALVAAMEASLRGERRRVVTRLPEGRLALRRTVWDEAGAVIFASAGEATEAGERFEEWLEPPQRLLLVGAGQDAQPMARMAALLGWSVHVVDGRASWARPERFPEADRVLVAADTAAARTIDELGVGERDAVVVMSHSYQQDRAWLTALLPRRPRYLGLLGARHRSALLVSETAATLGWTVERVCDAIFAPVGLALGGDGAEAIALATLAEIQAHLMGEMLEGDLRLSRRLTAAAVIDQIEKGGASRYLQAQCAL
jgi:xanthine/CO dehydrogenase XdhC/CoxF family maturation factor